MHASVTYLWWVRGHLGLISLNRLGGLVDLLGTSNRDLLTKCFLKHLRKFVLHFRKIILFSQDYCFLYNWISGPPYQLSRVTNFNVHCQRIQLQFGWHTCPGTVVAIINKCKSSQLFNDTELMKCRNGGSPVNSSGLALSKLVYSSLHYLFWFTSLKFTYNL